MTLHIRTIETQPPVCLCPLCRINALYAQYDADARAYSQRRKPPIVDWNKAKATVMESVE